MPSALALSAMFIAMSLAAWTVIAWVHLAPWVDRKSRRDALLILLTPQMFRHVGAVSLFPGIAKVPAEWAVPLAIGDVTTAILALSSMILLRVSWRHAEKIAWLCTVVGTIDLLHNAVNAARLQIAPSLGPAILVVGFGVPGMLVFHALALRTLLQRR